MGRMRKSDRNGAGSAKNRKRSRFSEKPQQRSAANARERVRMRVLSKAFGKLKTTLPWVPADTKLSKLDTLRFAARYIAHLGDLLSEEPSSESTQDSSNVPFAKLTWPALALNKDCKEPPIQSPDRQRPSSVLENQFGSVFCQIQEALSYSTSSSDSSNTNELFPLEFLTFLDAHERSPASKIRN